MVGLMRNIDCRENLDTEQQGNARGGKKPSCLLAYAPKSTEPKHQVDIITFLLSDFTRRPRNLHVSHVVIFLMVYLPV